MQLVRRSFLHTVLVLAIFGLCGPLYGQRPGWQSWQDLYRDSRIEVQVRFYVPERTTCQDDFGKSFKYEYRVRGLYYAGVNFVNWSFTYFDCYGAVQQRSDCVSIGGYSNDDIRNWQNLQSMEYQFDGANLIEGIGSVAVGYRCIQGTEEIQQQALYTDPPSGINGTKSVRMGDKTDLSVRGGSLGMGAQWVWYLDACGRQEIGRGADLSYYPEDDCTVFLRAEGPLDTTQCVSALIKVDRSSYPANAIQGPKVICPGEKVELTVEGGHLGKGASWVWYREGCGMDEVGTGRTLEVYPIRDTEYFVRAEGGGQATVCRNHAVQVRELSQPPASVALSETQVCNAEEVKLQVVGGKLGTDATWMWSKGTCDSRYFATGPAVTDRPNSSLTYYVRAEGPCNVTPCASRGILVEPRVSSNRYEIERLVDEKKKKKMTLYLDGGPFPSDMTFRWYKDACDEDNIISESATVEVSARKKRTYFVSGSSSCGNALCIRYDHSPEGKKSRTRITDYDSGSTPRDFEQGDYFQLGLGLGLAEWRNFRYPARATYLNGMTRQEHIVVRSLGLPVSLAIHPVFTEYFSLGFEANASVAASTQRFFPFSHDYDEKLTLRRLAVKGEMAFGAKPIKILVGQGMEVESIRSERTEEGDFSRTRYRVDQDGRQQVTSLGLRLGRYVSGKGLRGRVLDISYLLKDPSSDVKAWFDRDNLSAYHHGAQISFWSLSSFRLTLYAMAGAPNEPIWVTDRSRMDFGVSLTFMFSMFLR